MAFNCFFEVPQSKISAPSAFSQSDVNLFGVVGYDIAKDSVSRALAQADGGDIVINIDSPGGDYREGVAIYSMLKAYGGEVTINVLSMAASAASLIAMAADRLTMAENAQLMIHNSHLVAGGDKKYFAKMTDMLRVIDSDMAKIYSDRTGLTVEKIVEMMDAETFISAKDAISLGFADGFYGEKPAAELQKPSISAMLGSDFEAFKKLTISILNQG